MTDAYDPATRPCAKYPTPGITALQHSILRFWPTTTNCTHSGEMHSNVGTLSCRPTAGGTPSVHGNGRAGDIGTVGSTGQAIAEWLVANHTLLGVQLVIWNHRIWSVAHAGQGWRPYGCDRPGSKLDHHTTHIHHEINVDAGTRLTPAICESVRPGGAPPQPDPPEDWMKNANFMLTPDGNGIIVFNRETLHGKLLASPDEFNHLIARGWLTAYNPKNDQERMDQPTFDVLLRR